MSSPEDTSAKPPLSLADLAARRAAQEAPPAPAVDEKVSEAPVEGAWRPIKPAPPTSPNSSASPAPVAATGSPLPPLRTPSSLPPLSVPPVAPTSPSTSAPGPAPASSGLPPLRAPSLPPLSAPAKPAAPAAVNPAAPSGLPPVSARPAPAPPAPAAARQPAAAAQPASPPAARQKWGKDTPQTRQLKERVAALSGSRLVEALRQLLGQADDTLFKFVEQSSGAPNQEFLTAFKALRQGRASVERSFRESIDKSWGLVEEKKGGLFASLGGLSLVNEEELEENLAESLAVANAERLMSSEASALSRRLAIIDGLPEDEAPSNPLSASRIAEAFKSAMREVVDLPATAKMIVFKLFDREVLTVLPELLADVNQVFVDAGVLPELKPIVVKSSKDEAEPAKAPSSEPGQGGGNGSQNGEGMPSGYMGQVVPWEAVQSLLSAHRSPPPMIMGPDGVEIPAPPVPLNDLISAIQHLNESVAKLDNIEPMAFKKTLQELLLNREGKGHENPETLGSHEDAIDMIDLLFDFVLRDSELPSQIQTVLARLQMPYLRVAVLEPEVFAQEDHPARRLLNSLSDAGKTWNEATDKEGELRKLIEGTVETVLNEFERGSELCDELDQTFNTEWNAMKERAARAERRVAEAALGKEKLERARSASAKVIINNLAGLILPDKLRMAIHRAWAHYLTTVALREGEDSSAFRRATALLVQVAEISRAVRGAVPTASRKEEVNLLLEDWAKGLSSAGMSEQETANWKAVLADFCRERVGYPEDAVAKGAGPGTLMHEDIAASVTQSAPPNENVSEEAIDVVNNLKNGTWVQWTEVGIRAKLAWIGGFTGKLMFVDQRGNKSVETHKQVLAREIEQGQAVVLSDAPLVDQALGQIERKLSDEGAVL